MMKREDRPARRRAGVWGALTVGAALAVAGCAGTAPRPSGPEVWPAPDLRGRSVVVVPVQGGRAAFTRDLDGELARRLEERGAGVHWVLPPTLERTLERSPALGVRLRALPVHRLRRVEDSNVERIRAPLYGNLRRLAAVRDARLVLVPMMVSRAEGGAAVAAALIDTLGGRILWFRTVKETADDGADDTSASEAARMLARALLP